MADLNRVVKYTNKAAQQLKTKMSSITTTILDNMIAMPSSYPQTYLSALLSMNTLLFRDHMRTTNIEEISVRVGNEAYNRAL